MKKQFVEDKVTLGHGAGGKLSRDLIEKLYRKEFNNKILNALGDSAILNLKGSAGRYLAFTTDSFVIKPLFFPGGNIGKLAVCGTVNDLAVSGARPLYISASAIIEEGFLISQFEKIIKSMKKAADESGIKIVTGDTKVVEKGAADELFINTTGIGILHPAARSGFSENLIEPGDAVIINGGIAEHGIAVLRARENFDFKIKSDCAPLSGIISNVLDSGVKVKFIRDLTRGGAAAAFNEITAERNFGMLIEEKKIPVKKEVSTVCALLGFDPLYIANEGKFVMICKPGSKELALKVMKSHPLGKHSSIIGSITKENPGKVVLKTSPGGSRIIDMPVADLLPRIC
ncbi:MAG: hydrogenase expression/formation protein HypE [Elusimicrobiota bacterium]